MDKNKKEKESKKEIVKRPSRMSLSKPDRVERAKRKAQAIALRWIARIRADKPFRGSARNERRRAAGNGMSAEHLRYEALERYAAIARTGRSRN